MNVVELGPGIEKGPVPRGVGQIGNRALINKPKHSVLPGAVTADKLDNPIADIVWAINTGCGRARIIHHVRSAANPVDRPDIKEPVWPRSSRDQVFPLGITAPNSLPTTYRN